MHPFEPRRLLFAGDIHGSGRWARHVVAAAMAGGADVIVQAGDFGYWEHEARGVAFLDLLDAQLAAADLHLVFVDGNHENHTLLRSRYRPSPDGFVEVRPRVVYAPRGTRWTWRGVRFLAAGGAVSVDREWREPGESWWEEEALTEADVRRCIAGGRADVVVSHDSPAGVDAMGPETCGDKDADPASWRNRLRLRRIVDAVQPRLLVHGHYHHPKESDLELAGHTVRVVGLGRDGDPGALRLVDLDDLPGTSASEFRRSA